MSKQTLIEQLRSALAELDTPLVVAEKSAVVGVLAKRIGSKTRNRVALGSDPLLEEIHLADALAKQGYKLIFPPDQVAKETTVLEWRDRVSRAKVGITSARAIAAETGSALLPAGYPDVRIVSLLPEHHILLVSERQLVPDIAALMQRWDDVGVTRQSAVVVTGPSRTADIEKELVLGVHGPGKMTVILILSGKKSNPETEEKTE